MARHAARLPRRARARAARGGHRAGPLGRARPRGAAVLQAPLQGAGLPGAHPAGRRPGPPVPLHLRAVAQPRRAWSATPRPARSTSPGSRCRRSSAASSRSATSASCRSRTSSASTCGGSSRAWTCSRCTPSGSPATRTSRSRRTTPRTSSKALEKELLRRRFGPPVRLEVERVHRAAVLELLISELGRHAEEVFRLPGPLDLTGLHGIADLAREDLKYPAFVADHPPAAGRGRVGRAGRRLRGDRRDDVLLHHPYDSFATSVQRFIEQAAADPHVLAIKQTLYRTSGDSPIIDALVDAAEAGKQVLVIVEIKARFDEEANIRWARKLEQAGCHVVYGLVGLKTHCKLAMVVRDEPDGIRRYTHIGTGNYNPKTARLYEDLGLITADEAIGEDVAHLFNNLSGYSPQRVVRPAAGRARTRCAAAWSTRSTGRSPTTGRAARRGSGSRPTRRRRGAHRRALPRLAGRRAGRAAHPRHLRAAPRRTRPVGDDRGCARCSAGSSSTAGSSGSRTAASRIAWIGSADLMHRNLDRRVEVLVRLPDERERGRGRRAARPRLRADDHRLGARQRRHAGSATTAPSTSRRR